MDPVALASGYRESLPRDPRAVAGDLESFAQLVRKWNATQNLVSRETVHTLWPRHIADSLQLLPLIRPSDAAIADLGSGGGFPALPLAIALKGADHQFTLVEPIQKKVSFLRTVIRELGLNAEVVAGRAEILADSRAAAYQLVTSRALMALDGLLALAAPLLMPDGHALLHKGREHPREISESRLGWDFDVLKHDSATETGSAILEISNLRPRTS